MEQQHIALQPMLSWQTAGVPVLKFLPKEMREVARRLQHEVSYRTTKTSTADAQKLNRTCPSQPPWLRVLGCPGTRVANCGLDHTVCLVCLAAVPDSRPRTRPMDEHDYRGSCSRAHTDRLCLCTLGAYFATLNIFIECNLSVDILVV